jgi:hypothetical protein
MADSKPPPAAAADAIPIRWGAFAASVPMSLVVALVTALVTHWASPSTLPPTDELRSQMREVAADVREMKADARDTHTQLAIERRYTARNIPLMASVIEKGCSARFQWQDGLRPVEPEWLPPPLQGGAQWQPSLAMLPPPPRD